MSDLIQQAATNYGTGIDSMETKIGGELKDVKADDMSGQMQIQMDMTKLQMDVQMDASLMSGTKSMISSIFQAR